MAVSSYDPSAVSMFFGVIEMSGFAADAAITIEHDENDWELVIGVDGEGTRSKTSNKSATITVSLMQSSSVNTLLSAARLLDLVTPGGGGGLPILVKDGSGTSLFACETAWIEKAPSAEFSREASTREWKFRTDNMLAAHGSN